jgi:hypothetical protein
MPQHRLVRPIVIITFQMYHSTFTIEILMSNRPLLILTNQFEGGIGRRKTFFARFRVQIK